MKRAILIAVVLVTASAVHAQSGSMKGMDAKGTDMKDMPMRGGETKMDKKSAKATVHKAKGVTQEGRRTK